MSVPPLVGVVHLAPLPGSPRFAGDLDAVLEAAATSASALASAGFDAILVENYGDAPFHPDTVPPVTVAAMSRAMASVSAVTDLPLGVNVLRNDALTAVGLAAVHGAGFIRVNVLSGMMYTDQGPIIGRAADVVRARGHLAPSTAIFADVFVKHAVPPPGSDLGRAAADLAERGGADAVIVTGHATGEPAGVGPLAEVREAVDLPVIVGSGSRLEDLPHLAGLADAIIVGSAIRQGSMAGRPVDPTAAARFVEAARAAGFGP